MLSLAWHLLVLIWLVTWAFGVWMVESLIKDEPTRTRLWFWALAALGCAVGVAAW